MFIADFLLRRRDYASAELYDPRGRYGSVRWSAALLVLVGTAIGWGLITNSYGVPSGSTGRATCSARSAAAYRRVGVRQPRRARRAGHRVRRHAARRRAAPSAGRRPSPLPDPMRTATSSSSTCSACSPTRTAPGPRPGTPPRRRASAACFPRSLALPSSRGSSRPPSPTGAWIPYYRDWPDQLRPEGDPLWDITAEFAVGDAPVVSAPTFGKWGAGARRGDRRQPSGSSSPASRPTAACSRRRWPPPTRAASSSLPEDAAPGCRRPTTGARSTRWRCTGR